MKRNLQVQMRKSIASAYAFRSHRRDKENNAKQFTNRLLPQGSEGEIHTPISAVARRKLFKGYYMVKFPDKNKGSLFQNEIKNLY